MRRSIIAAATALGVITGLAMAAVPAQGAVTSAPELCGCGDKTPLAAGTDAAGTDFIVYGGNSTDGGLYEKTSSHWSPVEVVKGPLGYEGQGDVVQPAIAVHPNGAQDVFWAGQGNSILYEVSYVPGSGWGKVQVRAQPDYQTYGTFGGLTAGSDANGNDYLYWDGNGALYEMWHYRNGWRGPVRVYNPPATQFLGFAPASAIAAGPAAAVHANGQQDVVWYGYNAKTLVANIWNAGYANGGWSTTNTGITNVVTASPQWPVAGADATNRVDVFWLDANNGLYEAWRIGSRWYGGSTGKLLLNNFRYVSQTGPSVIVHPNGHADLFWYGDNSSGTPTLFEYSYNGTSWSGPTGRGQY